MEKLHRENEDNFFEVQFLIVNAFGVHIKNVCTTPCSTHVGIEPVSCTSREPYNVLLSCEYTSLHREKERAREKCLNSIYVTNWMKLLCSNE